MLFASQKYINGDRGVSRTWYQSDIDVHHVVEHEKIITRWCEVLTAKKEEAF